LFDAGQEEFGKRAGGFQTATERTQFCQASADQGLLCFFTLRQEFVDAVLNLSACKSIDWSQLLSLCKIVGFTIKDRINCCCQDSNCAILQC